MKHRHSEAFFIPLLAVLACGEDSRTSGVPTGADAGTGAAGNGTGGSTGSGAAGGASATGGNVGVADSGSNDNTDGAADSGSALDLPTLRPTTYRVPEPAVAMPPCAGNDAAAATVGVVRLGQTHLVTPDWPFLYVSANRPLTVALEVTGSGAPPPISVEARVAGATLGSVCLAGPASLPASAVDFDADLFRATLPAAWVQAGLELTFHAGAETRAVSVDVTAASLFTLYMVHGKLFDVGEPEPMTDAMAVDYAARVPFSEVAIGRDPFGEWRPEKLLIDSRDDGRTPAGDAAPHGPIVVDEYPHCTDDDRAASTCTAHSGFGLMSGVLNGISAIDRANAMQGAAHWYVELSQDLGGGLGGGNRGTGDDFFLTMNHEIGHAFGWPHWGAGHLGEYPYEGERGRGSGGFGESWAIDQRLDRLIDPVCEGTERQSPMSRSGATCVFDEGFYDYYTDYEAARLLQYFLGGEERAGSVSYRAGMVPFQIPSSDGRYHVFWNDGSGATWMRYDAASNAMVAITEANEDRWGWETPEEVEVPVRLFYGAALLDVDGHPSFINSPIDYVGNTVRAFDLSTPEGFEGVKERQSSWFYWAHDVHMRFTLDDDTVIYRLVPTDGSLRDPRDAMWFAVNLPLELGARVLMAEVLSRPLGHYDSTSSLLSEENAGVTHETFYDEARVLSVWTRP